MYICLMLVRMVFKLVLKPNLQKIRTKKKIIDIIFSLKMHYLRKMLILSQEICNCK